MNLYPIKLWQWFSQLAWLSSYSQFLNSYFKRGQKSLRVFVLALFTVMVILALPGTAQTAQVTPANPQLGDTISVIVAQPSTAPPPTVSMAGKTYPMFLVGPNRYRALVPTTPLHQPGGYTLQIQGQGQTQTRSFQLANRSFPTQSIWLPPGDTDLGTDYEFDQVDAFKALVTPEKFWNGPLLRPSQGEITTIYGVRRYYNGKFAEDYYHRGVDYAAPTGSPIVAPAPGRVALVGRESQGFELHGNTVGIDHGQGVLSIFLHLNRIDVQEGQMVRAGQVIGGIGSTGASTGPHLHWGLYVHGQSVDPVPWRYQSIE